MDIHLISSLTDDDEDRFASVVLNAMSDLLGNTPVAYSVRIETTAGKVLQQSRPIAEASKPMPARSNRTAADTRR